MPCPAGHLSEQAGVTAPNAMIALAFSSSLE